MRYATVLLFVLASFQARADPPEAHLLAGAGAFRAGQYARALVEFQVASRTGAPDAEWYAAASLVKLHRPERALESFAHAEKAAPEARDALFDYYRAEAFERAKLFLHADRCLAAASERAGPKIAALVKKLRAEIAAVLARPPSADTVDWYLARAKAFRSAHRSVLAIAFAREAASLASRRPDGHDRAAAQNLLKALGVEPTAGARQASRRSTSSTTRPDL